MKFNLISLSNNNLKQILSNLSIYDCMELLVLNKECYQLFKPLIWQDLDPTYGTRKKQIKKQFNKNSKYIEFLWLREGNINYHPHIFPNVKQVFVNFNYYINHYQTLKDLKITHFSYIFNNSQSLPSSEDLKLNLTSLFNNLVYFYVECLTQDFIKHVLPFLPSQLQEFSIFKTNYEAPFLIDVLNKFTNLKELHFYCKLNEQDIKLFKNYRLEHLEELSLLETANQSISEFNLYLYPKLKKLHLNNFKFLNFNRVSNLSHLTLYYMNLNGMYITQSQFPKLRTLIVYQCNNLSSHFIYNSLKFTSLTDIELNISDFNFDLLINEVYPITNTNLISLMISGFQLDESFFRFVFTKCPLLKVLLITKCEIINFNFNFNFNNLYSFIEFINIIDCTNDINPLIKFILDTCKRLFGFIISPMPLLEHNYDIKLTKMINKF